MTAARYRLVKEAAFVVSTIVVFAAFLLAGFNSPFSAFAAFVVNVLARMTTQAIARRKLRQFEQADPR